MWKCEWNVNIRRWHVNRHIKYICHDQKRVMPLQNKTKNKCNNAKRSSFIYFFWHKAKYLDVAGCVGVATIDSHSIYAPVVRPTITTGTTSSSLLNITKKIVTRLLRAHTSQTSIKLNVIVECRIVLHTAFRASLCQKANEKKKQQEVTFRLMFFFLCPFVFALSNTVCAHQAANLPHTQQHRANIFHNRMPRTEHTKAQQAQREIYGLYFHFPSVARYFHFFFCRFRVLHDVLCVCVCTCRPEP